MKRIISVFLLFNFLSTSSEILNRAVNCNSGVFIVSGNVGFDGDLNVCGTISADKFNAPSFFSTDTNVIITGTGNSTSCTDGALVVSGGAGIGADLNVCGAGSFAGPLKVSNTAASTSCTNGAFTVAGGVGINGNLNVCGNMSGPLSYNYSGCTGTVSRTIQGKLNDYWVDVKDFGAVGNGIADDSAAIQAALNCLLLANGGTLFFPSGSYKVNTPLNLTFFGPQPPRSVRIMGTAPVTTHRNACEIYANTGGVLFDCTSCGGLVFENLHIAAQANATITNPSTVAFLFQRKASGLEASFNQMINVSVDMDTIPAANDGWGTVAVYNYASELFYMNFCKLFGDSTFIITSQPLSPSFNSVYTTTNASTEPTTMFNCINCAFFTHKYNSVYQHNDSVFVTNKEHRFINCYCRHMGDPLGGGVTGNYAYRVNAETVNCEYSGQLETFVQYFNFQRPQHRTIINCNIGGNLTTDLPLIWFTDSGTVQKGPGLWGSDINLWTRGSVAVPLISCATGANQSGVYASNIYMTDDQFLDFRNISNGGNQIFNFTEAAPPTVLLAPTGNHGYLGFSQSSTIYLDGNLNLSGSGAYQQSGSFLVGQDVALNNLAVGSGSMGNSTALPNGNVTGAFNTAVGFFALKNIASGSNNTALGYNALAATISGTNNVALGYQSLQNSLNTTTNIAVGPTTMQNLVNSSGNIAIGQFAMQNSSGASNNIALGLQSAFNAAGSFNVAIGRFAMQNAGAPNSAIAIGNLAMQSTGSTNAVAIGVNAMNNGGGISAVAIGNAAMQSAAVATNSIAIGVNAMKNAGGSNNIAIGPNALLNGVGGSNNIAVGNLAGSSYTAKESNNIVIGSTGTLGDSGIIRIGSSGSQTGCFIAGIRGATTNVDGVNVVIDSSGKLGTIASSARYKTDINDIKDQTQKMMQLRPVSFSYKSDASQTRQYGLIAEEVHEIYPELVIHQDGEIYTVNYMALISLLLKQIQELEKKDREFIQQQAIHEKEIKELKEVVARLVAKSCLCQPR